MPLARWAVYQGGPQIWLALTADDSDGWIASVRHIAIEAGAFVISVPQYIPARRSQPTSRSPFPTASRSFGRGGACIVAPTGDADRRARVRHRGDARRRLRPARGAPREAVLRRRRPLQPRRRAGAADAHATVALRVARARQGGTRGKTRDRADQRVRDAARALHRAGRRPRSAVHRNHVDGDAELLRLPAVFPQGSTVSCGGRRWRRCTTEGCRSPWVKAWWSARTPTCVTWPLTSR